MSSDLITKEQWGDVIFLQNKVASLMNEKAQLTIEFVRAKDEIARLEYIIEEYIQYPKVSDTLH